MINRKLHIRFRLAPRSMILDDRELVQVRIFREFRGISQIWQATATAKRMTVNPYCQGQRCDSLNLVFKIMFLALICRRFLGASYTHCCRSLTLALARLSCYLFVIKMVTASSGPPIFTLPT